MVSAKREPITEVWGRAPSGVQRQNDRGSGVRSPLKPNVFLHYYNLRSRPICPKICFSAKQKFSRTFRGVSPVPLGCYYYYYECQDLSDAITTVAGALYKSTNKNVTRLLSQWQCTISQQETVPGLWKLQYDELKLIHVVSLCVKSTASPRRPVRISCHTQLLRRRRTSFEHGYIPAGRLWMSSDSVAMSCPVFGRSLSATCAISEPSAVHARQASSVLRLSALFQLRIRRQYNRRPSYD